MDELNKLYESEDIFIITALESADRECANEIRQLISYENKRRNLMKELYWTKESGGDNPIAKKISKACKSVKKFIGGITSFVMKVMTPALNKAKQVIDTAISKTTVKDEYSKPQKMILNVINSLLKQLREYASKIKNEHGYERLKAAVILLAIPVPGPVEYVAITVFSLIDLGLKYANKIKLKDVENAVDELDKAVGEMKTTDPDAASTGTILLDKLRKVLSIAKSQMVKLTSQVKSITKRADKSTKTVKESVADRQETYESALSAIQPFEI